MNLKNKQPTLSLDPSSTRTGYSVMQDAQTIVDAGFFRPIRVKDKAEQRIDAMVEDLEKLLVEFNPANIVIEVPSTKPGAGLRSGGGARLATYGRAVGNIEATAKAWARQSDAVVTTVSEQIWTKRRSKIHRRSELVARFPTWRHQFLHQDSGFDMADAVGINCWWLQQMITCGPKGEA